MRRTLPPFSAKYSFSRSFSSGTQSEKIPKLSWAFLRENVATIATVMAGAGAMFGMGSYVNSLQFQVRMLELQFSKDKENLEVKMTKEKENLEVQMKKDKEELENRLNSERELRKMQVAAARDQVMSEFYQRFFDTVYHGDYESFRQRMGIRTTSHEISSNVSPDDMK